MMSRSAEFLGHNLYEPWAKDYHMTDKIGQPMDAALQFEFLLEPVTLDFIRFRGDQGLGHLVEPICEEVGVYVCVFMKCGTRVWCLVENICEHVCMDGWMDGSMHV
jgi:hypothetical protein